MMKDLQDIYHKLIIFIAKSFEQMDIGRKDRVLTKQIEIFVRICVKHSWVERDRRID